IEGHRYAALAGFAMKLFLLCLIVPRWEYFFTTVTTLGVNLGLHAGGDRITQANFLNPGAYVQLGVDIGALLYQQWDTSQISNAFQVVLSPVLTAAYFLAWVIFLLAFFLMGLLVFM